LQLGIKWIEELGAIEFIRPIETKTTFRSHTSNFRLSTPLDLLRFQPIPILDRIRTGWLIAHARSIKDWTTLEKLTAKEWIIRHAGLKSYETIWEPLLIGKFAAYSEDISAVWMWSRLAQRGTSRDKTGQEILLYFDGGYNHLFEIIENRLKSLGVKIARKCDVQEVSISNRAVTGLVTSDGFVACDDILCTVPLPIFMTLVKGVLQEEISSWANIRFMANICLALVLSEPLSDAYWTNIGDKNFPFVVAIEHTNFDQKENYEGHHIVYLSRYLTLEDPLFQMNSEELVEYTLPFLKKLYPHFRRETLLAHSLWREPYSQPIPMIGYTKHIPPNRLSINGLWLATMAQIYPEGRSTNVIVKNARQIARQMVAVSAAS
jgi:protoporphyrinogen oxidase